MFLQGSDVYRFSDPAQTAKEWQVVTILMYASASRPLKPAVGAVDGQMKTPGERVHCGTMLLVGWSDAAYGDQSAEGKCRLGCLIGPMSSSLNGSRHVIQWLSEPTRKRVRSSLGGDAYAFGETGYF